MSSYTIGQIGLNFRGDYIPGTTYSKLDVVTYNGSSYVAIAASTNVTPDTSTHWKLLAHGYEDDPKATPFSLDYGTTSDTNGGNGQLRWRKLGGHVYLSGGVTAQYNGSVTTICTLPSNVTPANHTVMALRACGGARVARIQVTTAGEVRLDYIRALSDGSTYTSAAIWIDLNFDYWID